MKSIVVCVVMFLLFYPLTTSAQRADHVVISEFATQGPSSGSDEFVELYNPTEAEINLLGWTLQYKTSSGTVWSDRAVLPGTAVIPAHGFFLIANTSFVGTDSADYKSSLWTSSAGLSSIGHVRIIDASSTEIDKVGYGTAIDPEGSPAPGQAANNQSVERKAYATSTADSLATSGLHYLEGNGYDSNNNANDFVQQTHGRNPQTSRTVPEPAFGVGGNGTGRVTVTPNKVFNNRVVSLTFTVTADSGYPLTHIRTIVPSSWGWTNTVFDVALIGPGFGIASASVDGDTIDITSALVTNVNTGILTLSTLTSPTSQTLSTFRFLTAVEGGMPAPILAQPNVAVNAIIPIVNLHVNTSQGVQTSPYVAGALVAISGTVTANLSGSQTNVFIQDASGGVDLYSPNRPIDFQLGDSVVLSGSLVQFRGLLEVSPDFSNLITVATGRPLPEPMVITCADINNTFQPDFTEPNEGRLIRVNGVSYNSTISTITDNTGTADIFIPSSFPPTPTVFDVIGILKQFKPGTPAPGPPYTGDYEIQPRFPEDIIGHPGPVVTVAPSEDSITSTSILIGWGTDVPSSSIVFYDSTTVYRDSVFDATLTTEHNIWLTGLAPATFYHYGVASEDANGRTYVSDFLFSTASPPGTTGVMNVYFNRTVDTSLSAGEKAFGNQDLISRLVQRINNARYSVDACFYNLSSTPGTNIANALIAAKDRGVKVRVICEDDNVSNAPFSSISANGIPLITDAYDAANGGSGLMHNKFVVIDARGGAPESVWVWTGSWNPTDPGTNGDRQNSIEIQDLSLAKAYLTEFNEMWGNSVQPPNAALSRFGARKTNNTPHKFNVNGSTIECYFSPSDRTTAAIGRALSRANYSVSEAMYTFTRKELADTLIALKNRGRKVRMVLDNNTDLGTQYSYLSGGGVDIHVKGFSGGLLHHKYAVVDGTRLDANQWVITGSHNWSSSAENSNNENTLIIQNNRVANLYMQEFYARYLEAGGSDPIILGVQEISRQIPGTYSLSQNYPNPFNPVTKIRFSVRSLGNVSVKVYDVLGREIESLLNETKSPGTYEIVWDASRLSSGVYYYQIKAGAFVESKKAVLLR